MTKELIINAPLDTIRTHSGLYMNVFEPTFDMVNIEDIAHALSNQCRFSGHLKQFYSVAQHSIFVSHYVSTENKLSALMHDSSESYLLDIPTPIKRRLADYKLLEDGLMKLIAQKFSFKYPFDAEVKEADAKMLNKEWDCLMLGYDKSIDPMGPEESKNIFWNFMNNIKNKI